MLWQALLAKALSILNISGRQCGDVVGAIRVRSGRLCHQHETLCTPDRASIELGELIERTRRNDYLWRPTENWAHHN